jgi:alkylated DNA repair dioxygenase AlkB
MPPRQPYQQALYLAEEAPEGFVFQADILSSSEEKEFLDLVGGLSFGAFRMHGIEARRRIAHFGLRYASGLLTSAPDFPIALEPLRERAAAVAGIEPAQFAEVLVTEYQAGAGIGWHRDSLAFGVIAGVSLGATCRMRFQKGEGTTRQTWAIELPSRSLYLLTGKAREEWQHSIPPLKELRYSITFRTLRSRNDVSGQDADR